MGAMSIAFQREFRIWAATVGHGQLLLRSVKSETHGTRVDVAFFAVSAVAIPETINNLVVEETTPDHVPESVRPIVLSGLPAFGKIYRISGDGFTGFIAAGDFGWREDDGEFDDWGALYSGPAGHPDDVRVVAMALEPRLDLLRVLTTAVRRRRPEIALLLWDIGRKPIGDADRAGLREAFITEMELRGLDRPEDREQKWRIVDELLDRLTPS